MQSPPTPGNGTAPPRFRVGDLKVDTGRAEVTRGDEKISLPKLSFDLLCVLINAAPAIVTNDDLLQQVWPGLQVSPESVAQRVKLLRSAIGDDSQQPRYILGVRGRGYRLIPAVERLGPDLPRGDTSNPPVSTSSAAIPGEPISQTSTPRGKNGRPKRAGIAAAVLIAVGVAVVLALHYASPSSHAAHPSTVAMVDKSIAVLPFTDMSEKKDQEYFADGMAEEIIDLLVKIPGLKVISRTSSFQFKGKTEDLRAIGRQLGVAYVLEGSVRKSGEHLRVTAQLIDSSSGTHLFSQTYDRDLSDVLKLQDEIAIALVRALQIEVGTGFFSRPALRNTEAYTLYLQGQHAKDRFDQPGVEQAISDFERVLELDPSFAPAELWLGNAYFTLGLYGFMPPAIAFEKSRQASERALKLDPSLAMAHAQLGDIHRVYDWDRPATDRELKLALALAPANGNILFYASGQSLSMGRWDEAVKQANAALAQDPLSQAAYGNLCLAQLRRGRLEEAESAARRTLEINPAGPFGHSFLGSVLLARSQPEAALREYAKEPVEAARLSGSAMAYFALGSKADSDAALAKMIRSQANRPYFIARVYGFRGEPDEALKWLDRAYAQKDSGPLSIIKGDPAFKKIEGDPRYKAFLRKMNLPE